MIRFALIMSRLGLLAISLLWTGVDLIASDPLRPRFGRLGIEDGLAQSTVLSILRDHDGFMWFGTYDGLNRYDGYHFEEYRQNPDDLSSISGNTIQALFEDSRKRMWVGTTTGLSLYLEDREQFRSWDESTPLLANAYIYQIAEDHLGRIVLATNGGLVRVDLEAEYFEKIPKADGRAYTLRSVETDGQEIWAGGQDELLRYNPEKNHLEVSHSGEAGSYGMFYELLSDGDQLWAGTQFGGLRVYNPAAKTWKEYIIGPDLPDRINLDSVRTLGKDDVGRIWVGTDGGQAILDENGRLILVRNVPGDNISLSDNRCRSFFYDPGGVYWVGTSVGLNRFTLDNRTFRTISAESGVLNNSLVWSLMKEENGHFWVGTDKGLSHFDSEYNLMEIIMARQGVEGALQSDSIWSMVKDSDGSIWLGTEYGLSRYRVKDQYFDNWKWDSNDPASIPHDWVKTLLSARDGRLWLGTDKGLRKFDGEVGACVVNPEWLDPENPIAVTPVRALLEEDDGLWVGTEGAGLLHRAPSGARTQFVHVRGNNTTLANNSIKSICRDASGRLWVGTSQGLSLMLSNETFRNYGIDHGLPNEMIYGILEDPSGRLWLSTNRGIACFEPDTEKITVFDKSDGLLDNEFNQGAYLTGPGGTFFFGGVSGVSLFDPMAVTVQSYAPKPVFSELHIAGQRVKPGANSILQQPIHLTDRLVLPYEQRQFSLAFMMPNYKESKGNSFVWRLEGLNDEGIPAKNNSIVFNSLPPGTYTLTLAGINSDGVASAESAHLGLVIQPPPWLSWWARSLYALLLTAVIVVYLILQQDRLKRERRIALVEREAANQLRETNRLKTSFVEQLEQKVADRTAALEETTREVTARNEELELFETILENINSRVELDDIFEALLKCGIQLFQAAESGCWVSVKPGEEDLTGFIVIEEETFDVQPITLPRALLTMAEESHDNLEVAGFRLHHFRKRTSAALFSKHHHRVPEAIIVNLLRMGSGTRALLIFSNFYNPEAFENTNVHTITRFKAHALLALEKAEHLRDLEVKNREILHNRDLLVMQEKMASLGTLSAGIAHEIKNPLNFVNNFAETGRALIAELREALQNRDMQLLHELTGELEENLGRISDHGCRADHVVSQLMEFTRAGSGHPETIPVHTLLQNALENALESGAFGPAKETLIVETEFRCKGSLCCIPKEVMRAFCALLENAGEALAAEMGSNFEPRLQLKTEMKDRIIKIEISDNGIGIAPEHHPRLFEPFFTTHPPDKGHMGLGLTLCYEVLSKGHGGSIHIENNKNRGARVLVSLPVRDA